MVAVNVTSIVAHNAIIAISDSNYEHYILIMYL